MARVIVYHYLHGCDTGCCGHSVQLDDGPRKFYFDHPNGQGHREYAERLIRETFGDEHVSDLDWENCLIVDD